jgi:hypothetical protein
VHGAETYLNNSSTVMQIRKQPKDLEKHQQWLFITENDTVQEIPEWMHIRLRDSIAQFTQNALTVDVSEFNSATAYAVGAIVLHTDNQFYIATTAVKPNTAVPGQSVSWTLLETNGYDVLNKRVNIYKRRAVPDFAKLHRYNLLGNEIRPYAQSWFDNVLEARRTLIIQANSILKNIDLVYSVEGWDDVLSQTSYLVGTRVLDMTACWQYVDYESVDYDADKEIAAVVQAQADVYTATVDIGDYIKVAPLDLIYQKTSEDGYAVVYRKNGTIEFLSNIFNREDTNTWDSLPWDNSLWDLDSSGIVYSILDALRYNIFVNNYTINYKKLMVVMLRYVLSEQLTVDWVQKASTIKPFNLIGQDLDRSPDLTRDQVDTLKTFYSSVKSYRDKLRDASVNKTNFENVNTEFTEHKLLKTTMYYARHDESTPDQNVVSGINFYTIGWDDGEFDSDYFDPGENGYDLHIQKVFNGDNDPAVTLQGRNKRDLAYDTQGEELVRTLWNDRIIIDVEQFFNPGDQSTTLRKIRMYQYMGIVEYIILDPVVALIESVENSKEQSTTIKLSDMTQLPDASVDNIQYIWINHEKIGYTIKTETGISGLLRGAHGTTIEQHSVDVPVYIETAQTTLIKPMPLLNTDLKAPFLNDLGATLHESTNATAKTIRDYLSS